MSNSIGNLKNSGLQGNNFPWQLKMLQGLQAIYDATSAPLTCVDQITVCGTSFTEISGVSALNVNVLNPIPLEVIINEQNDSILIYGFDAVGGSNQAVSVDSSGNVNANIVSPLGQQFVGSSVSVALGTEQANVLVIPAVLESGNAMGDLSAYAGNKILSISFASRGTAFALVSVDGGATYVRLYPGETLNLDANGVMNQYDPSLFYWDTVTNPTSQLLIAFNYI